MRKIRRYVIIPFIYVGVIFGLVYLQYSGTLTVRRSIDALQFTGTLAAGEDETSKKITAARVEFEGLVFRFSEEHPLVVHEQEHAQNRDQDAANEADDPVDPADATDSSRRHLVPVSYEIEDTTLQVHFSDGSVVRFEAAASAPAELLVVPLETPDWPVDATVTISWNTRSDTTISEPIAANPDNMNVMVEDRSFILSLPPRSVVDRGAGTVAIPPTAATRLIRYVERLDTEVDVVATAFSNNQHRVSEERFIDAINRYVDVGYQGWASTRFNGGSGTWDMRDGSPRFSEEILTAYLAEAWRKDQYVTAFNRMRRAADQHPDRVGFLSAPFLGNLREVTADSLERDRRRAEELAARIAERDPRIFRDESIVPFSLLQGSEELYQDLTDFIAAVDYREVDLKTAIGMYAIAVAVDHPAEESEEAARRFEAIREDRIYPAVRRFEDQFFLETAQGEIDLQYSIRAGMLLELFGRTYNDALAVTVGRNLVLSGLQLADTRGFLPQLLFFGEQGLDRREGSFGPEELYPTLSDNPHYPRMISLYDDLGAGSFIWTITEFTDIEIGAQQHLYKLRYPRNRTHYIVMQGIPQFESMLLFNLQWRNDPTFELYVKGRHYEASTETLLIKYTDNSEEGEIILYY